MDASSPMHNVWRMLGAHVAVGGSFTEIQSVTQSVVVSHSEWEMTIREAARLAGERDLLVIAADRPLASSLLRLASRRRWSPSEGPSLRRLVRSLEQIGFGIEGVYAVWPSAEAPRIAVPVRAKRAARWLQRSGVLGGGGNRVWLRIVARSPLVTPLVTRLYPAIAVVARKEALGRVHA